MDEYTVIDLEMTGLSAKKDKIIEIGAARVRQGCIAESYSKLVNPQMPIPERITQLTGITDEMAAAGAEVDEAVEGLLDFMGADVIVGHNVRFDYSFIKQWAVNHKRPLEVSACDTLKIARVLLPKEQPKTLEALCEYFGIQRHNAHRALDDAVETVWVFEQLKKIAQDEQKELFVPVRLEYKAKRQTPATVHQLNQIRTYRMEHHIQDEIAWETMTRSEASRLMDYYYSAFGR